MIRLYILGIGPGHTDYILPATQKIIDASDIIIGGKRNLSNLNVKNKNTHLIKMPLINTITYIKEHYKTNVISVVVSGDTGFYSMLNYIKEYFEASEYDVIPGISSMQYMFSKIKKQWDQAYLGSVHGREINLRKVLEANKTVGLLTDSKYTPSIIAKAIEEMGMNPVIYIGERLSYIDERISKCSVEETIQSTFDPLSVVVISYE